MSFSAALQLDNTRNCGEAQRQDWRALLCEQHSGSPFPDTAVSSRNMYWHLVGITNTAFLKQAECKVDVISWHSGKLARVARSSDAAELQAAADAEGELTGTAPLKKWQEVAAQVPATLVRDSRGVYVRSRAASHLAWDSKTNDQVLKR